MGRKAIQCLRGVLHRLPEELLGVRRKREAVGIWGGLLEEVLGMGRKRKAAGTWGSPLEKAAIWRHGRRRPERRLGRSLCFPM